jgi:hypothetical protein
MLGQFLMRNFELLNQATEDAGSGVMSLTTRDKEPGNPTLALRREGGYIVISASYGPFEIALRPRFQELTRALARLQPVEGLQTTRQVGTGQAYIALGLRPDGTLLMRPTIVADATGLLTVNLSLTSETRQTLFDWLQVGSAGADI